MAASSVNTSRELGAVAGVAVLGSVVNGVLVSTLVAKLGQIPGLPASLRSTVIAAVTTGTAGTQASNLPNTGPIARIVEDVLAAANTSFSQALEVVLVVAGVLLLVSAAVPLALVRRGRALDVEDEAQRAGR